MNGIAGSSAVECAARDQRLAGQDVSLGQDISSGQDVGGGQAEPPPSATSTAPCR